MSDEKRSIAEFTQRTLIVLGLIAGAIALWQIADVLILVFGGVVFAVVLHSLSHPIVRATRLSLRWALLCVLVGLFAIAGVGGWLLGEQLIAQMGQLWDALPDAWEDLRRWLEQNPLGGAILEGTEEIGRDTRGSLARLTDLATTTFGALVNIVLLFFVGVFLAADPKPYQRGIILLVPERGREKAAEALTACGQALRRWLLGQFISMVAVGTLIGLGLWMLGIPMALPLGIVAGLLEFIPFVGPIIATIPAVLIGFTQGPWAALYVIVLFVVIQQVESNIIMPLAQRWAVALPPALGIVGTIIFALLFGVPGLLFATPLMVMAMVLVQKLYVEGALEETI